MDDKEKLYLMLEEYRSVRSEELQRTRLQYQLYATAVALSIVIAGLGLSFGARGLALFLIILTAALFMIPIALLQQDILGASRRAREIEGEINRRTGERLYARESERAPFVIGTALFDRVELRQRWSRFQEHGRERGERWRRGMSQFRESVRSRRRSSTDETGSAS
jgi:hypothetical protein